MNKYYLIIILIIYYIIANYSLLSYTNSTYEIINDIYLKKNELLICSHSYEHIDIFIIINEYIKKNIDVSIVFANELWNQLLEYYLYSIGVFNIHFIYVTSGTVQKVKDTIHTEPVIIYLYKHNNSKGIYHILNKSNIKAYICKITSNHKTLQYDTDNVSFLEIFANNFNKHYYVEYNEFNYTINMNPELFIEDLKYLLY